MANNGKSYRGPFGTVHHYDKYGKKVGTSTPGLFGTYTNYDAHGKKAGHSTPGIFGSYNHYDKHGRKTGQTFPSGWGTYRHEDTHGNKTGSSAPGPLGSYHHTDSSQGCYVATCVYGSYDCPQVWTLRRFRDDMLAKTAMGRAFIRVYYAVSPMIVRLFGAKAWFAKLCRRLLDPMVLRLHDSGVEDTPYCDRSWR